MKYTDSQVNAALRWKAHSESLPDAARVPAPYVQKDGAPHGVDRPICLPPAHAALNLIPDAREIALSVFEELEIPWHHGFDGGPSNHLLSSQVQCANALSRMTVESESIVRAFGDSIEIGEMLEIEPDRFLTFEYIGPEDYLGEQPGRQRTRGARCTSVDAAFKHRAPDGKVELVLVEWKYTESYLRTRKADPEGDAKRTRRYAQLVAEPGGPVRNDVLPFEFLLDEPFYQLVRQQLLAHRLEMAGAEGADRVRVLHVLDPANDDYQRSLVRPENRAAGATVSEVWSRLLRHRDRFSTVDPNVFLDARVTSREYVHRYATDVVWDHDDLATTLGLAEADDLENAVYAAFDFDGDVRSGPGEIELYQDGTGIVLTYPFRLLDLREVVDELDTD